MSDGENFQMPKNRKRVVKGAKSVPIRTKNKIGGRKSGQGVKQMSTDALLMGRARMRDRFKLKRELIHRGVIALPS
jgi:hypothetical protein